MADAQTLARRAAVAAGREPADLVLKNAGVVNVFTKEITVCDVAVADGYVAGLGEYSGRTETDCTGKIVCPGFIDAHTVSYTHLDVYKRQVYPGTPLTIGSSTKQVARIQSYLNALRTAKYATLPKLSLIHI